MYFSYKQKFYLMMAEHTFSRISIFLAINNKWWMSLRFSRKYSGLRNICITQRFEKLVTVVDSLSKSLLSGAIRKIRDSFPPATESLTFDGSLNFPLRIDFTAWQKQGIQLAFHFKDRSSLCRLLTSVPSGGGTLI